MGIIGEVDKVEDERVRVVYSKGAVVAGWNAQNEYDNLWVDTKDVEALDPGLNSAWTMDMDAFKELSGV